jgi:hypothetical protein
MYIRKRIANVMQKNRLLMILPVNAKKCAIIVLALSKSAGAIRCHMSGAHITINQLAMVCITYI